MSGTTVTAGATTAASSVVGAQFGSGGLPALQIPAAAKKSSKKSYRSTERRLTAKTIRVHRALRAKFPRIKKVLGFRPGSAGEHRLGRALDVMLPGNTLRLRTGSGQADRDAGLAAAPRA